MELSILKDFLDACYKAKHITELMPKLPEGMTPRHVHVLDVVYQLGAKEQNVKVSDISSHLNVTRPSITKLIRELEEMGVLEKVPDKKDKRVIHLNPTSLGKKYYDYYVEQYHSWLAEQFSGISEEDFLATIRTIGRVSDIMNNNRMEEDAK